VDAIVQGRGGSAGETTFRTFILKLVSFCNLNCSYCYMFNSLDRSHVEKPRYMSPEIAVRSLHAIEVHLACSDQKSASMTLHGGEPTLWPVDSFRIFLEEVESVRNRGIALHLSLQTNLWQKPKMELLELCAKHRVGLGVSLDGPSRVNDLNRTDFAGRGSYNRVLRNVRWLIDGGFGDLFLGFLCVMQPDVEPADFLEWVASLPLTQVDLLWPIHYTAANPPWTDSEARYRRDPRYGKWLESLFEAWWIADRPEWDIDLFTRAVEAELGGQRATDMLGARSFGSVIVNTDGAIEMADYFRTARDGGSSTGYSILKDDFDTLARDERFRKLHRAARTIPKSCRSCKHVRTCEGGTLSGRLDASGRVTARRSVLCHDHLRFFDGVARRVEEQRLN
jgi:uncharacterized protein